jgi:hypothetical protein
MKIAIGSKSHTQRSKYFNFMRLLDFNASGQGIKKDSLAGLEVTIAVSKYSETR